MHVSVCMGLWVGVSVRLVVGALVQGPSYHHCVATHHDDADALPQPCHLKGLPASLGEMPADVLEQVPKGRPKHPA